MQAVVRASCGMAAALPSPTPTTPTFRAAESARPLGPPAAQTCLGDSLTRCLLLTVGDARVLLDCAATPVLQPRQPAALAAAAAAAAAPSILRPPLAPADIMLRVPDLARLPFDDGIDVALISAPAGLLALPYLAAQGRLPAVVLATGECAAPR